MDQENKCLNDLPTEIQDNEHISSTVNRNDTKTMDKNQVRINNYVKLSIHSSESQNSESSNLDQAEQQIYDSSCRLLGESEIEYQQPSQQNNVNQEQSQQNETEHISQIKDRLKTLKKLNFLQRLAKNLSVRNNAHRVKVQQQAKDVLAQQQAARQRMQEQMQSKSQKGYSALSGQNI
eukprot:TRINITY_DN7807_c0_g4_i1.p2 TRINITY_DN7807_c0_g4~~TRINITY_DN7807_c0_g4_i1.p2  ORF type:complete len:178 (+),score=13.45 TRINITY_DN7807_c0_g4_i1:290-823(+)